VLAQIVFSTFDCALLQLKEAALDCPQIAPRVQTSAQRASRKCFIEASYSPGN
jgi:hypothetical protein